MTCNKNIAILVLMAISLLGFNGCKSQPYKPWQAGESWWDEEQARKEADAAKAEEMTDAVREMQASQPSVMAEPVPAPVPAPPKVMEAEPEPAPTQIAPVVMEKAAPPVISVKPSMPVQADSQPSQTPPPMVVRKPEAPLASKASNPGQTSGDILLIDSINAAPAIQTPRNGTSMAAVRQQYGDPKSEGSSIGDPPITRWEYEDFSVYFEYEQVLHSVVHRPNQK